MADGQTKIILTGYRATGKSSVGRLLAARLGFDFLDMDREIESREGRTIREMVAAHGWDYFRERERELLAELVDRERLVIAAGGGAVMHGELWQRLKESGLAVWLTARRQTIVDRLAGDARTADQRPSLTGEGIAAEVARVLAEREPLYRQGSHLAVATDDLSPEAIVERIEAALRQTTP